MDKETKARIADFFTASDLVDYLGIKVEDVIDTYEAEIEEALDDIEELMGVRHE